QFRLPPPPAVAMGDVARVAAGAVVQVPPSMRILPAADADGDLPPRIDVDALLLGSGEADLEQVAGHVDGGDLASQEELRPGRLGVVAHGLRELAVVDRGVRLRPDRSVASDVRFVTADVGGR